MARGIKILLCWIKKTRTPIKPNSATRQHPQRPECQTKRFEQQCVVIGGSKSFTSLCRLKPKSIFRFLFLAHKQPNMPKWSFLRKKMGPQHRKSRGDGYVSTSQSSSGATQRIAKQLLKQHTGPFRYSIRDFLLIRTKAIWTKMKAPLEKTIYSAR